MRTTYGIAIRDGRFLMVFNPKRNGWEMPGGKLEPEETFEEAVIREFYEETGLRFVPKVSKQVEKDCIAFAGTIKVYEGQGEMMWQEFETLPCNLGFPECEYEEQIAWAKSVIYGVSRNH